ncbi:Crp/Fnr family transcriptional regulator [Beggiatoa leptomitoformis]|uniref:Helix-turn-helix domain-containing protein n=1 Tax=Beggiatoa leptomitoformis TaxID=288004 RepID=A0A2N9YE86_9GAMM|nr:Crp/Fnr family transcriptional regulator [Beggiatoa leptomitoformis]ALG68842.1 helix-turn-helix domain-containing protein [Beggiatoa leptomitoformis]AUI68790.1 helix-turn-helix domain-containing protein [Beggiatoa leptomitoformis]
MHPSHNIWLPTLEEGQARVYVAGEIISRPEKTADQFFVIQQGQARVFLCADNKELTIGYLKPNSIYVTHTRAWIEAVTDTEIMSWPIRQLKALMSVKPEIAVSAMQEIGTMLRNTLDIIEDLAFRSVEARLARYLLMEYNEQKQTTIKLIGNTEILASLLGTTRQTFSTIINRMIKEGILNRADRQCLTLLNLTYLAQLAKGMSAS